MQHFEEDKSSEHSCSPLMFASKLRCHLNDLSRFNYRSNTANNALPGSRRATERAILNLQGTPVAS